MIGIFFRKYDITCHATNGFMLLSMPKSSASVSPAARFGTNLHINQQVINEESTDNQLRINIYGSSSKPVNSTLIDKVTVFIFCISILFGIIEPCWIIGWLSKRAQYYPEVLIYYPTGLRLVLPTERAVGNP